MVAALHAALVSALSCCWCMAEPGSRRASQKGRKRKQRASAAAHLPSVPVEAAVNMLLARAGFDLLRSAAFKQRLHAHIQRKLDVLRVPEYIQSIEVRKETLIPILLALFTNMIVEMPLQGGPQVSVYMPVAAKLRNAIQ